MMSVLGFIRSQSRLITTVVSVSAAGALTAAYLGKRKLDQTCPTVPITALPKSSACRHLIERAGGTIAQPAWGLEKSALLSSWSGSEEDKTHWIPSFAAIQVTVPVSLLTGYRTFRCVDADGEADGAYRLMQNLVAAFLDARAASPEAWFLDQDVPPLSFTPATHLFGRTSGLGAFMLGAWSSARQEFVGQPLELPEDAPQQPVSEFPSNRDEVIHSGPGDRAGAVMYWTFPGGQVRMMNKAASYGLPWRLMEGGFQEYIVEKVSNDTARVTYVSVEAAHLHPLDQPARDFKRMPWLAYQLHVLYAQYLLYNTLKRLRQSSKAIG